MGYLNQNLLLIPGLICDDDVWNNEDPSKKYVGMYRGEFGLGDEILYLADGGGGYGSPLERDVEKVRNDVIDGYVSIEAARKSYGVVINEDMEINQGKQNVFDLYS